MGHVKAATGVSSILYSVRDKTFRLICVDKWNNFTDLHTYIHMWRYLCILEFITYSSPFPSAFFLSSFLYYYLSHCQSVGLLFFLYIFFPIVSCYFFLYRIYRITVLHSFFRFWLNSLFNLFHFFILIVVVGILMHISHRCALIIMECTFHSNTEYACSRFLINNCIDVSIKVKSLTRSLRT